MNISRLSGYRFQFYFCCSPVGARMELPEDRKAEVRNNGSRQCCAFCILYSGAVILFAGLVLFFAWPYIFAAFLKDEMVVTNSSKSFQLWKETPIPMYLEVHMFNWTNPEESLKGAVPNFVEVGPYIFTEKHTKVNLKWNSNETITFRQVRKYVFVPEMSNGSLSDRITSINVIAMTIGQIIKKTVHNELIYHLINPIVKKFETSLYVRKTVKEFLFDGFDDRFLDIIKELQKIVKIKLPFDKFGWFYQRNNSATYDGVFEMQTGASSLRELGEITRWNYRSQSPSYKGNCGLIRGSTGELWPIDAAERDNIEIFAPDICGTLSLSYSDTKQIQDLDGYRHVGNPFDNGQSSEDTSCFCINKPCSPSGTRDVSSCRYGAPAYISYPHFYLADPSYGRRVSGMKPDKEKHELYLTLEKATSVPLEVHARMQINIRTEPIPGLSFFNGLPSAYLPVLWFDQRASLTPELALELKPVSIISSVVKPVLAGIVCIGLIAFVLALILLRKRFFKKTVRYSSFPPSPGVDSSASSRS